MFYLCQPQPAIWQGRFSLFPDHLVRHAISTRFGGISEAPYDTMNLALHTGDEEGRVRENRRIFCKSMGICADRIVTPEQVHGDRVRQVTEKDAGRGSASYADALKGTDALITDVPGLPLLLCFADCTPLLFFDPVHRAAGIAHGGWRGTVQRIGQKTVAAMGEAFGTQPKDVLVGIGPSIGPCCYEVGPEVSEQFRREFPNHEAALFPLRASQETQKHLHLDLWAANRVQFLDCGVLPEHIDCASVCTCCNAGMFFSYRASGGRTGRIGAVIAVSASS